MSRKVSMNNGSIWVVVVLTLCMTVRGDISCVDAVTKLIPCQPFLVGSSSNVTVPCCEGAASLDQMVGANPGDIKALCHCLKQTASSAGINVDRAKQLPQLCKINVPVPIDPNVNCDGL